MTHRSPEGKETFVLRSFGLKAWEIDLPDLNKLGDLIQTKSIFDRPVKGDLLMHVDPESGESVPDANATFLYQTKEGNWGLVKITDRVVRKEDITGRTDTPAGVGFHLGVRIDSSTIIP